MERLLKWLPLVGFVLGLPVAVASVAKAFREQGGVVGIILLGVGCLLFVVTCLYVVVARKPQGDAGAARVPRFPKLRPWAVVGLVAVLLASAGIFAVRSARDRRPPDKFIVLVAEFDGPDRANYQISQDLVARLTQALVQYGDVTVRRLDTVIKEGSQDAVAIGQARKASVLIWGWYAATTQAAKVCVHFELLRRLEFDPPPLSYASGAPELAALADLTHFSVNESLASGLTFACLFAVGLTRYSLGQFAPAEEVFSQALAQAGKGVPVSDKAAVLLLRGNARGRQRAVDSAFADFSAAIRLKPDLAVAYNNRGIAYAAKGEYDKAIRDFNKAIRLKYDSAEGLANRAVAFHEKGVLDSSMADVALSLKLKPDYALAYYNRGTWYGKSGEYDKAISDFNDAIRLNPRFAHALNNRGLAHNARGDYDKALSDFAAAVRLWPGYVDARINRGCLYLTRGYVDKAVADFAEAVRCDSNSVQARYNLGYVHLGKRMYDWAISDFTEAIRLNETLAQAFYNRGVCHLVKRELDKAAADLVEADRLKPDSADFGLACLAALKGETEEAFRLLEASMSRGQIAVADVERNELLASLRSDPRWSQLLAKYPALPDSGK